MYHHAWCGIYDWCMRTDAYVRWHTILFGFTCHRLMVTMFTTVCVGMVVSIECPFIDDIDIYADMLSSLFQISWYFRWWRKRRCAQVTVVMTVVLLSDYHLLLSYLTTYHVIGYVYNCRVVLDGDDIQHTMRGWWYTWYSREFLPNELIVILQYLYIWEWILQNFKYRRVDCFNVLSLCTKHGMTYYCCVSMRNRKRNKLSVYVDSYIESVWRWMGHACCYDVPRDIVII